MPHAYALCKLLTIQMGRGCWQWPILCSEIKINVWVHYSITPTAQSIAIQYTTWQRLYTTDHCNDADYYSNKSYHNLFKTEHILASSSTLTASLKEMLHTTKNSLNQDATDSSSNMTIIWFYSPIPHFTQYITIYKYRHVYSGATTATSTKRNTATALRSTHSCYFI